MIRHLDLFAGIGGFSRGLSWLGGETVAFVEWDAWCRRALFKHWPDARYFGDIKTVSADDLRSLGRIDLITGGYPCQPFSLAGQRRGHDDPRHLWPEMRRVIDILRPTYVLAENVAGHISMGLDTVLDALEADGYTCRPVVVPAGAVDAFHRRERVWIMAYSGGTRSARPDHEVRSGWNPVTASSRAVGVVPDSDCQCGEEHGITLPDASEQSAARCLCGAEPRPYPYGERQPQPEGSLTGERVRIPGDERRQESVPDACSCGRGAGQRNLSPGQSDAAGSCEGVADPADAEWWPNNAEGRSAGWRNDQATGWLESHRAPAPCSRNHSREAARSMGAGPDGVRSGLVRRSPAGSPDLIRELWANGLWESGIPRVVSEEVDRRQKLQAAGNAIVPIVAYELLRVMLGGAS